MHDNTPNHHATAVIYGLIGIIVFGFTLPVTRIAIESLDIIFVGLGRAVLAAILAGLILFFYKQPIPAKSHWLAIVITSLGVVVGFPLFATIAMKYGTASHGGVILAILPLCTSIASVFINNERPSLGFWICSIIGSITVIIFALTEADGFDQLYLTDLLLLLAIISASIGYAQGGQLSKTLGGWQVICWALVFGAPFLIPFIIIFSGPTLPQGDILSWTSFIYLALFSQLFGFFAWNKGLAMGGISKISQLQLLQPFVTLIASWLLIGEQLSLKHFIFASLVVSIVALGRNMKVEQKKKV